jgi:hypothetical protein
MRQRRDKIQSDAATGAVLQGSGGMPADAFVVHGKRNPENGIRRWAKSEYAEVAKNTLYPNGVPANLSDNNATRSGSSAYAAAGLASTLGIDTSTLAKRNHGLFDAGAVYQMTIGERLPVVVAHDEAGVQFLDSPRRRKPANHHHLLATSHKSKAITIPIAMPSMLFMRSLRVQVSRASSMPPIVLCLALHSRRNPI